MWSGLDDGSVNESHGYKKRRTYGHDKLQHPTLSQTEAAEEDPTAKSFLGTTHLALNWRPLLQGRQEKARKFKNTHASSRKGEKTSTCAYLPSLMTCRQPHPESSVKCRKDENVFIPLLPDLSLPPSLSVSVSLSVPVCLSLLLLSVSLCRDLWSNSPSSPTGVQITVSANSPLRSDETTCRQIWVGFWT